MHKTREEHLSFLDGSGGLNLLFLNGSSGLNILKGMCQSMWSQNDFEIRAASRFEKGKIENESKSHARS